MHTAPLVKIDVTEISVPGLNETQRKLAGVLAHWGPHGERWCNRAREGERSCAVMAIVDLTATGCKPGTQRAAIEAMKRAAWERGFEHVISCSDSSFPNARAMVLRAITLAGQM